MKILIISKDGECSDLAVHLQEEDHSVTWGVDGVSSSDLVMINGIGFGKLADKLRRDGYAVIGGSSLADRLESDTNFGSTVLGSCGMEVIPLSGINISISAWFNGDKFLKPVLISFEDQRLGTGDIGPAVGKMGVVGCYRMRNKLFSATLEKIAPILRTSGYRGLVGLNCSDEGFKFTIGFRSPLICIQDELHSGQWGTFLYRLATGQNGNVPSDYTKWGAGVTICAFPGYDIPSMKLETSQHIHLGNVDRGNRILTKSLGTKRIAVCTGSGHHLEEAVDRAYGVVKSVDIPDGFYRLDIGERVIDHYIPELQNGGLIR